MVDSSCGKRERSICKGSQSLFEPLQAAFKLCCSCSAAAKSAGRRAGTDSNATSAPEAHSRKQDSLKGEWNLQWRKDWEEGDKMFCTKCGKEARAQASYCFSCGEPIYSDGRHQENTPNEEKDVANVTGQEGRGDPSVALRGIQYADLWRRVIAHLIDGLVCLAAMMASIMLPLAFIVPSLSDPNRGQPNDLILIPILLAFYLSPWLYYSLMESSKYQATLGKIAVGIIVTNMDGARITFLNATGRFFGKILSSMPLGFGYLMAIYDPKFQALHDQLARTIVIHRNPQTFKNRQVPGV
jgi:uncharacterized RDD family membrane protein YckC